VARVISENPDMAAQLGAAVQRASSAISHAVAGMERMDLIGQRAIQDRGEMERREKVTAETPLIDVPCGMERATMRRELQKLQ
jgi:hypothetical protein